MAGIWQLGNFLGSLRLKTISTMAYDVKTTQVLLSWLPGYSWSYGTLRSTGAALSPTMHMSADGEIVFYVRPIFTHGATVGLFLKKSGIEAAIARGQF